MASDPNIIHQNSIDHFYLKEITDVIYFENQIYTDTCTRQKLKFRIELNKKLKIKWKWLCININVTAPTNVYRNHRNIRARAFSLPIYVSLDHRPVSAPINPVRLHSSLSPMNEKKEEKNWIVTKQEGLSALFEISYLFL